jgi:dihydroorotate dehydrogenase
LIYALLFRRVLQRLDAETVHALSTRALGIATAPRLVRAGLRRVLAPRTPSLTVRTLGMTFPSPLGVAAGMDKDAGAFEGLGALGFGFVEVGTVTALGQPGNERPRIRRLPEDRALLNSMGFPNAGAEKAALRLRAGERGTIVGVNVGRSKAVDAERAAQDYRATIRRLGPLADYLVLNVSSPNTPGLRAMQAAAPLQALVEAVREELS